jgi:8-oxo-dGTP pyrophosphatase MutT (NUDIX family)
MHRSGFHLPSALAAFAARHPERGPEVALFSEFLGSHPAVFCRQHRQGHFTGSAWIVDRSGASTLLTLHAKLGRWLQLGGHADGEQDLAAVARREAEEESGLGELQVEPAIFDIDRHRIPARGDEAEHWHYDVRFVVRALGTTRFVLSAESTALAWRPVAELLQDPQLDASLQRMAQLWLKRAQA